MTYRLVGVSGWITFGLLGWISPLVPSLVPTIEHQFGQSDPGIGLLYFVQAVAFTVGAIAGGVATERIGRRAVLVAALFAQAAGLATLALAGEWPAFVVAGAVRSLGTGAIEGGVQGLILDVAGDAAARDVNLLHVAWSAGALAAPIGVALIVGAGAPWQAPLALSAVVSAAVAALFAVQPMPSGRRGPAEHGARLLFAPGLLALAIAIAAYVAAESGVAAWLVRFLSSAPLIVSSTALSLFWGGLTLGRLLAARFRVVADPLRVAGLGSVGAAAAIAAAVVAPSPLVSIACFGIAGFACGPIYPMIIVAGGRLAPGRGAAASGMLSAAAVVGAVVYPPVMGSIAAGPGIGAAMLGAAALAVLCGGVALIARAARPTAVTPSDTARAPT